MDSRMCLGEEVLAQSKTPLVCRVGGQRGFDAAEALVYVTQRVKHLCVVVLMQEGSADVSVYLMFAQERRM